MEMTVVMMMMPVVVKLAALQDWVACHKQAPPESSGDGRDHVARPATACRDWTIIWLMTMTRMPHDSLPKRIKETTNASLKKFVY